MISGLEIVQINVTDLALAWQFYVETLELPGVERLGPGRAFHLELADAPSILVYPVRRQAERRYPDDSGVTLVFATPDIKRTVAIWRSRGVEFVPISWAKDASGIADSPLGPFIAFKDPFGNVHELIEPAGQRTHRR